MQARIHALALVAAFAIGVCSEHPTAPKTVVPNDTSPSMSRGPGGPASQRIRRSDQPRGGTTNEALMEDSINASLFHFSRCGAINQQR